MKIAESWLREWVNPDLDTEALGHQLTMLGHEVDGIESKGAASRTSSLPRSSRSKSTRMPTS